MKERRNFEFIRRAGQEMYFDQKLAEIMVKREENVEYVLTSKIVEAILATEFGDKKNLKIVDVGAGAHPEGYEKFLRILKENKGEIYWVDQSPIMLSLAKKKTPEEFREIFEYVAEEMAHYLRRKQEEFDGLVFKYSFHYLVPCPFDEWIEIIYGALKKSGKIVANLNLYEGGIKERSYNAIYTIKGKEIKTGYTPKDGEIIEVHFLSTPGDQSPNPETFASTKIIYHSLNAIKKTTKRAGFSRIKIFKNWEENKKWKETFEKLNPNLCLKQKPILLLKK